MKKNAFRYHDRQPQKSRLTFIAIILVVAVLLYDPNSVSSELTEARNRLPTAGAFFPLSVVGNRIIGLGNCVVFNTPELIPAGICIKKPAYFVGAIDRYKSVQFMVFYDGRYEQRLLATIQTMPTAFVDGAVSASNLKPGPYVTLDKDGQWIRFLHVKTRKSNVELTFFTDVGLPSSRAAEPWLGTGSPISGHARYVAELIQTSSHVL